MKNTIRFKLECSGSLPDCQGTLRCKSAICTKVKQMAKANVIRKSTNK